ncbi:MAG: sugar-binding domain-containing protein [Lachnospiraceae bacterium]|nr:sugar-binding domain-containing protein [Lachnospiraceae bacterium]
MKRKDERFLMRVADMYYNDELSQEVIADKLNVSRTTISRALSNAKKAGYIKIVLDFPSASSVEIEKQLEQTYNIQEAGIALTSAADDPVYEVCKTAARYLARVLKNDMIIGLTWGRTMKQLIDAFEKEQLGKTLKIKGVQVVPFLGTNAPAAEEYDIIRLTYSSLLSSKLSELIRGINYSLPAPMYVQNPELKKLLLQEPEISRTLDKARQCQVALFSIGDLSEQSAVGCLSDGVAETLQDLKKKGGIGETLGRVFDRNGNTIESDFNDHIIGLSLEDLKKIPTRVCIVYDDYKIEATKIALKNGLINVLITDDKIAEELLKD